MRTSLRLASPSAFLGLVTLLLQVGAITPARADEPANRPSLEGAITIRGTVSAPDGTPLAGVRAELHPWDNGYGAAIRTLDGTVSPPADRTTSSALGRFELRAPAPGAWRVVLRARGRLVLAHEIRALIGPIELPGAQPPRRPRSARGGHDGATPAAAAKTEAAAEAARVRVMATDGTAIEGARIEARSLGWVDTTLRPDPDLSRWLAQPRRGRTNANGWARLDLHAGERLLVTAIAPGFGEAVLELRSATAELILPQARPREIEVVDLRGKPIANAVVRVGQARWPVGRTNTEGRCQVELPVQATMSLRVETADGRYLKHHHDPARVAEPSGAMQGMDVLRLLLPDFARLRGQVVDRDNGRAIPKARVWLPGEWRRVRRTWPPDLWSGPAVAATVADSEGRFALALSPEPPPSPESPGPTRSLNATAPGYRSRGISLEPGTTDGEQRLDLHRVDVLRGRVVNPEGQPIEAAEIQTWGGWTRSDANGRFRLPIYASFPNLTVTARGRGFLSTVEKIRADDFSTGMVLTLEHARHGFGRLVDPAGQPVPGARVRWIRSSDLHRLPTQASLIPEAGRQETTSDGDGRFELFGIGPPFFDFVITAPGFALRHLREVPIAAATAAADSPVDLGEIHLETGHVLQGLAVDPDGAPIADVVVSWSGDLRHSYGKSFPTPPSMTTDAEGRFTIADRAAGERLRVWAEHPAWAAEEPVEVEMPRDAPLELVLRPGLEIRGRVLSPNGAPVLATQKLSTEPRTRPRFFPNLDKTAEDGTFHFRELKPGTYWLWTEAEDLLYDERAVELQPGAESPDLEIVLERGAELRGEVRDSSGEPVPGATLQWTFEIDQHRTTTDAEGAFTFTGLAPGSSHLKITAPSGASEIHHLDLIPGPQSQRFELEAGPKLEVRGRVVDPDQRPVKAVSLSFSSGAQRIRARSDTDGAFVATGLRAGRYQVSLRAAGFITQHNQELRVDGPIHDLEISLSRGGTVYGQILGLDPEAPEGQVRAEGSSGARTQIQPGGTYRLENVPPGLWTVLASAKNRGTARERVEVRDGEEVALDLDVSATGASLRGRLSIDGAPPRQQVNLSATGLDVNVQATARTDAEGLYALDHLRPGRYRLSVAADEIYESRELEISGDQELDLELVTFQVRGIVRDPEGAVDGARIELLSDGYPQRSTRTQANGRFSVSRGSEGDWQLHVSKPGYVPASLPLEVDQDEIEVVLEHAGGLRLRVRDAWGGAPGYLSVLALDSQTRPVFHGSSIVSTQGEARLPGMPSGAWTLLAKSRGFAATQVSVTVPGPETRLVLAAGAVLDVVVPELVGSDEIAVLRVKDFSGRPMPAWDRHGSLFERWQVRGGRAQVEDVPVGTWRLTVTRPDGRAWEAQVTVPAPGARVEVLLAPHLGRSKP